jgi:hypothetical protein
MTFPVIKLEVERMQYAIKTALTQYEAQLDSDIQQAVDLYCTSENIQAIIHKTAVDEINRAIRTEIEYFFRSGNGKETIRKAVNDILDRETE